MTRDHERAFAAKTRQLYEQTFGGTLDDHDLIAAIDRETRRSQENFLRSFFRHAGLTASDLTALTGQAGASTPLHDACPPAQAANPPKFKKSDNNEWMFNFEE